MSSPRYLIGIDLGTTNTVVAYADISTGLKNLQPQLFEIEQLVGGGEVAKRSLLPSFRYHPTRGELAEQDLILPWQIVHLAGEVENIVIGEWARELGAKVEGRLVCSAKSWLSHTGVDRSAAVLPWASADGVEKVSPVFASASYLNYIRQAWNHQHPHDRLEAQEVIITVPASFDEAARALTVEAAQLAGIPHVLLLEEPQAVCYDWYTQHREKAVELLRNIKLLLVCDVGGGTTDLSLIQVKIANSQLALNRIGVGDHLMLGGDNVDFALTHIAEKRIVGDGKALNAASFSQLIQQTRRAKEILLAENAPETAKVTVLGSGAKLIGGTRSCELSREEVLNIALNGFFPQTTFAEKPEKRRSAIVQLGLPYVADPAVSKHIAEFLGRHQSACYQALELEESTERDAIPDAVLFNGGVFNSPLSSKQVLSVLSQWCEGEVSQLENIHPNLAVAFGAVGYGLARRGAQLKIGGGSARGYFLKLDNKGAEKQGVCLLPKGTEEGIEVHLSEQKFALRIGQPVQFHLLSSIEDTSKQAGELCVLDTDHYLSLPPLVAALEANTTAKQEVEVELVTTLTEVGTLQLQCVSLENTDQRWNVEFEIRKNISTQSQRSSLIAPSSLPANFDQAKEKILNSYGQGKKEADLQAIKQLRNDLDKILGKRDEWDTALLRAQFDIFLDGSKRRRRSMAHERVWFTLAGFALRPGSGFPLDEWRIQQIWPLYEQGLQFSKEQPSWSAWWTFWRRAAGGLNEQQQQRIFKDIGAHINPTSARKLKSAADKNKAYEEMVRLVGVLENLPIETKIAAAQWLLKRLEKASETPTAWWALGRIASREPFYGSAHKVLPKEVVHNWLATLLKGDWKNNQNQAFAVVMLARMSGDRNRDLDEKDRHAIIDKLQKSKVPASWIKMVSEVTELDETEIKRVFGESLPPGLRLIR